MHEAGIPVYGWTLDSEDAWSALADRLDAVITNRPTDLPAHPDTDCGPVTAP